MKSFTKFFAFSFLMVALSFQVRVASANQDAEVKLAEKYLVKLTTGNRPVFLWNGKYIRERYKAMIASNPKRYDAYYQSFKKFSTKNAYYIGDQAFSAFIEEDDIFSAFIEEDDIFIVDPDTKYQDLFCLIEKGDDGEAITTWIDYVPREKKVYNDSIKIRYATNDEMKNVPIIVDSKDDYNKIINLKAKMVDEDLSKYFFDDNKKKLGDSSVGLCWTTTWDNLRSHWEDLLAEGNKSEVITQIRKISESGRFNPKLYDGGEAWKERIDGFYKEKSLYPSFTIINSTGVDCEGEIDWVNSTTRKSVATTSISVIKNGWSSKVDIPFEEFAKLNDGETLSPTVRFWVPNNRCCGEIERKDVVQIEKYGNDLEYTVKGAGESWLSETNATIFGQIHNLMGRSCVVEFNGKMSDLTHNGTFTFSVAAHRGGKLSVKENGIEVAYLEIKGDDLHKATNKSYELSLPDKAKPKLTKVDIELPKEGLFTFSINNGRGGVVFNGNLDDYENGASIKDRLVNAANIPVSISNGIDIQEILDSYLKIPKEISPGWKLVGQADGYIIISYNGNIPSDKYLELPKTLKVVNRDECIAAILQLKKQPVEKRKLMKTVSEKMPSWKDALIGAAKNNNCAAAVVLENNTEKELSVNVTTGKIAANSSLRLSDENIDTIQFKEDGYANNEYISNSFSIKSFDPLGDDQSISISEETLAKKPAPKVRFKDAVNIREVKISYSDNKSYSSKDIADGIELRMHQEISNLEIKWNNSETTSVLLPKSWYRYGEDDITIPDTMPSEIIPLEPKPKPEPKVEEPPSCSKCGAILNNGVCANCSKAPDKRRITLKLKRYVKTLKNLKYTDSYTSAMLRLQKECTNAQKDGLTLDEFKELCKAAGIPEEVIKKLK